MILGDNIFYGNGFDELLLKTVNNLKTYKKATVFGYYVNDPNRYGVLNLNENQKIISIVEKPTKPMSNYAVTGLYFYPNSVIEISKGITKSDRGELEITAVNNYYLENNQPNVVIKGLVCLTIQVLQTHYWKLQIFIQTIEKRQGKKVACIEEIAYNKGYKFQRIEEFGFIFTQVNMVNIY